MGKTHFFVDQARFFIICNKMVKLKKMASNLLSQCGLTQEKQLWYRQWCQGTRYWKTRPFLPWFFFFFEPLLAIDFRAFLGGKWPQNTHTQNILGFIKFNVQNYKDSFKIVKASYIVRKVSVEPLNHLPNQLHLLKIIRRCNYFNCYFLQPIIKIMHFINFTTPW